MSLSFENQNYQDNVINEDQLLADIQKIIPFADIEVSSQEGDSGIDIPNVINLFKLPQNIISSKRSSCFLKRFFKKIKLKRPIPFLVKVRKPITYIKYQKKIILPMIVILLLTL